MIVVPQIVRGIISHIVLERFRGFYEVPSL